MLNNNKTAAVRKNNVNYQNIQSSRNLPNKSGGGGGVSSLSMFNLSQQNIDHTLSFVSKRSYGPNLPIPSTLQINGISQERSQSVLKTYTIHNQEQSLTQPSQKPSVETITMDTINSLNNNETATTAAGRKSIQIKAQRNMTIIESVRRD